MMERVRAIGARSYERVPSLAQDVIVSAYGAQELVRRRGLPRNARQRMREIDALHHDPALADREVERCLRGILDVARGLRGYRDLPSRASRAVDELATWPVLSKEDVRADQDGFLSRATVPTDIWTLTSGTTGTPLKVWRPRHAFREIFLAADVFRSWFGLPVAARRASFTGKLVVPLGSRRVWRLDVPGKRVVLSQYHLAPRHAEDYAAALRRFRPQILDGYTSNLVDLAQLFDDAGISVSIPMVVSSSEVLTPAGRALLERTFGGHVADKYGSSENVVIAHECPAGHRHLFPNVGLVEVLDDDGRVVPDGERGRLVLTTLTNDLMPLVRYEVGDVGAVRTGACECGRTSPVLVEVVGREDDVVITPDGRRIAIFAFNLLRGLEGVVAMQLVQRSPREFLVRARLADAGEREAFDATVLAAFDRMIGPDPARRVEFDHEGEIARTPAGKIRNVIREF